MPSISKIRFTNVIYEGGNKRYNDETFLFDGHNGAILLENGGGKTVFIQTVLQTVLPHVDLADRKIKDTLKLEDSPAHIAVEWILNERPRRYALTCISLFLTKNGLDSLRYVYEYGEHDKYSIDEVPFVREFAGKTRAADRGEIQEYYSSMAQNHLNAKTFDTIKSYKNYLEENFHIIPKEWESIVKINSAEGGVEHFFDECKTTGQLFDRLLIPTVEESMAGFQKDEFAETFEKHRASFKEYKQLKEKIAENERIKEHVGKYVEIFAGLDQKRREYQGWKGIAKAHYTLAKKEQQVTAEEYEQVIGSLEDWNEKQKLLEQKEASYEIAVEKEKLDQVLKQLTVERNKQADLQDKLTETDSFYYSLKLAEYKKNVRMENETKQLNEEKLTELDKEFNAEEIIDALHDNGREIKGYFVALEETFKKEQQKLRFELNSLRNSLDNEQRASKKVNEEQKKVSELETKNKAVIEKNNKDLKDIQSTILANPEREKVEELLEYWIQTNNELDAENSRLMNRNKEIKSENEGLGVKLSKLQASQQASGNLETELNTKKQKYDEEHQLLKLKLAEKKLSWSKIESVYLKQDSIEKQVIEDLNKTTRERDELLSKERLAFRFVDDYADQDVFYADAYLSQQIQQWQQQFSYIETGLSYIQTLPEDVGQLIANYPLWPITIVTTAKEKTKLREKIKNIYEALQFPLNILSLDEATEIVKNDIVHYTQWIQPKHWEINSSGEAFVHWKENIRKSAETVKQNRLAKEKELQSWHQLQNDLITFYHQYPFAQYQEIQEQLAKVKDELFQLSLTERNLKQKIESNENEFGINDRKISENKDLYNGHANKIEKAQKFMQIKKENQSLEKELLYVSEKRKELEADADKLKKIISDYEDGVRELELSINEISTHISSKIYGDRLYQKVKDMQPTFTAKTIETLEQAQYNLNMELNRLSKGRNELDAAIANSVKNIQRLQHDIEQLRQEQANLNEELEFPLDGVEKMNNLWARRKELAAKLKSATEIVGKLQTHYDTLAGSIEAMMKKIERYISFDIHLELARKQLDEEKTAIQRELAQVTQLSVQLEKQLKSIGEVVIQLEKYDPKHMFLASSIIEAVLSSEEITELTYSRRKTCDEIIAELEARFNALQSEGKKVERAKADYIDFCRQDILDIRMREMAIQGIENKDTYEEVLKYKGLLEGRIQTAIKYAEQNIISHDQQLEQFIIHIHAHIKKIADELKLIPKKTSVKVDDQWKEIFSFHIPDWDEQEGKADIRDYIHWILDQLEKEGYKDENGHDDVGKIKKDLEKWLQSKQLLHVVMKNQSMKVTCRKVTNDNKVTKGSYSWEQSNVWSGGEKWSKNMTLFLGILNYIAEKRQHIQAKMKRHRSVIVDNPFGKASSDHVLNPVFFIAEQLGFQIIALTAHAEGKFLRDYFPVLYSCRLRNAAGSEKQIMTKEKNIKHAYFRDHDPKSLERLGEIEQMELF